MHKHMHEESDWSISLCICLWTNQIPYVYVYSSMKVYLDRS